MQSKVANSAVHGNERLLLYEIAVLIDDRQDDGFCFADQDTLSHRTGLARSTLQLLVHRLTCARHRSCDTVIEPAIEKPYCPRCQSELADVDVIKPYLKMQRSSRLTGYNIIVEHLPAITQRPVRARTRARLSGPSVPVKGPIGQLEGPDRTGERARLDTSEGPIGHSGQSTEPVVSASTSSDQNAGSVRDLCIDLCDREESAPPRPRRRRVARAGLRPHLAFQGDRIQVPKFQHDELTKRYSGDRVDADTKVREFYAELDAGLGDTAIAENMKAFIDQAFSVWLLRRQPSAITSKSTNKTTAGNQAVFQRALERWGA